MHPIWLIRIDRLVMIGEVSVIVNTLKFKGLNCELPDIFIYIGKGCYLQKELLN